MPSEQGFVFIGPRTEVQCAHFHPHGLGFSVDLPIPTALVASMGTGASCSRCPMQLYCNNDERIFGWFDSRYGGTLSRRQVVFDRNVAKREMGADYG